MGVVADCYKCNKAHDRPVGRRCEIFPVTLVNMATAQPQGEGQESQETSSANNNTLAGINPKPSTSNTAIDSDESIPYGLMIIGQLKELSNRMTNMEATVQRLDDTRTSTPMSSRPNRRRRNNVSQDVSGIRGPLNLDDSQIPITTTTAVQPVL